MSENVCTQYESIKSFFPSETDYQNFCHLVATINILFDQFFEIYNERLLSPKSTDLINVVKDAQVKLKNHFAQKLIEIAQEYKTVPPLPGLEDILTWINEMYSEIFLKILMKNFLSWSYVRLYLIYQMLFLNMIKN